jgi:hypothetical protein
MIDFLISNEYLLPCKKYYLPKNQLRDKYNIEKILSSKALIYFHKTEKIEAILNDFDANSTISPSHRNNESVYFEDVLLNVKKTDPQGYQILNNIFFMLTPEYDYSEIMYLSGYKEDVFSKIFKKYKSLFNVIITTD